MRNRQRQDEFKPDPMRAIFDQNQLSQAIWLEMVPHLLKILIVDPGTGPNPRVGQFVRLRQFIYLSNMVNIRQERITYTFGRKRLIPGLEYSLSIVREGFKGRIFIDSSLAYGKQSLNGVPPYSSLVFDIEVSSISAEPMNSGEYDDQELINEIIAKARSGDGYSRSGNLIEAQRCYEDAFQHIQSNRCKEIHSYLYSHTKMSQMKKNGDKTQDEINLQIKEVVEMYRAFDMIKIKAVEAAVLNKDYYKVILLTKQCMMESRLEQNQRILKARAIAFAEVGQFGLALKLANHLHDQSPKDPQLLQQLRNIEEKYSKYKAVKKGLRNQPVLALTLPNNRTAKRRVKDLDEEYEADEEKEEGRVTNIMQPRLQVGAVVGSLDYF